MSSGIIGALGNSSSVTYTPSSDAKVLLACASSSTSVTVNGVIAFTGSATITCAMVEIFCAAGVAVTIATGASSTCIVSALES